MRRNLNRTLNTKDREKLKGEFQKTREQYIKDVNKLRKKYKESLVELVLAYGGSN